MQYDLDKLKWINSPCQVKNLSRFPCVAKLKDCDSSIIILNKYSTRTMCGEVVKWDEEMHSLTSNGSPAKDVSATKFKDIGVGINVPISNSGWYSKVDINTGSAKCRRWLSVEELSKHILANENSGLRVLAHNRISCIRRPTGVATCGKNQMTLSHEVQNAKPACIEEGSELHIIGVIRAESTKIKKKSSPFRSLSRMLTPKSSKIEKSQQHHNEQSDYEYYPGISDSSDIIKCTMQSDPDDYVYLVPCNTYQAIGFSEVYHSEPSTDNTSTDACPDDVDTEYRARKLCNFVPTDDSSLPVYLSLTRGALPVNENLNKKFTGLFRIDSIFDNIVVYAIKDFSESLTSVMEISLNNFVHLAEDDSTILLQSAVLDSIILGNRNVKTLASAISLKSTQRNQCMDRSLPPIPPFSEEFHDIPIKSLGNSDLNCNTYYDGREDSTEDVMDDYGYMIPRQQKTNHLCYSKSDLGPSGSGCGGLRCLNSPLDTGYTSTAVCDHPAYSTVTRHRQSVRADTPLSPPPITPLNDRSIDEAVSPLTPPPPPPPVYWGNSVQTSLSPTRLTNLRAKQSRLRHAHSECDIIDSRDSANFDPRNRNEAGAKSSQRYQQQPRNQHPVCHSAGCSIYQRQSSRDNESLEDIIFPVYSRADKRRWSVDRMNDFLADSIRQSMNAVNLNLNIRNNLSKRRHHQSSPTSSGETEPQFNNDEASTLPWIGRNADNESISYSGFAVRESDCSTPKSPVTLAAKYSFASDPGQVKSLREKAMMNSNFINEYSMENFRGADSGVSISFSNSDIEKNCHQSSLQFSPSTDLAKLGVNGVTAALHYLGLPRRLIDSFHRQRIDGPLLSSLDSSIIQEAFPESNRLDRKKIVDFIGGWRPRS